MEKSRPCPTSWRFDFALLDISNIKKLIPLVLDPKKDEYSCWSTLFRNTARAYDVLHHIDTTIPTPSYIDASLWAQLDAVVLSWIYATISTELLMTIINEKSTAMDTWTRLQDLFQRNYDKTHQNSLSMASYSIQPQSLNLLSNYVEQQPMPPRQKRKLNIDLNEDLNEDDESEIMDLISSLPDDVLVYLLSLVDIKTAGRTSVLSKSWRHAWACLMDLNFDNPETVATALTLSYPCFAQPKMDNYVKWVNQVISANKAPYLNTFRIHFPLSNFYAADIENWLKFSFSKEVCLASSEFPTFVNVKQLEIIFREDEDDSLSLTSLIKACPLVHTFKLKWVSYTSLIASPLSAPKDAQANAIRSLKHLHTVEYVGYAGCRAGSKLALFLTCHAPMLNKFVFDPHQARYVGKPITCAYNSKYKDQLANARSHSELLAKRIRGRVDVVIL